VGPEKFRVNTRVSRESVGKPAGTLAKRPKLPTPETTMQTDSPVHRVGGRLSREDQRRLGDILQRVYDDVVRQGVPERFRQLLGELDRGQGASPEQRGTRPGESENDDEAAAVFTRGGLGEGKGSSQ
jgi:hypothetical protein